jgi:hypothetical protein
MSDDEIISEYKKGRKISSIALQLKYIEDAKFKESRKNLGTKGKLPTYSIKDARLKAETLIVKNWDNIVRRA